MNAPQRLIQIFALWMSCACFIFSKPAPAFNCLTWIAQQIYDFTGGREDTRLRVAILDVEGSLDVSVEAIEEMFTHSPHFNARKLSLKQLLQGDLDLFDILLVPGGRATQIRKTLGESGSSKIRNFVDRGGGYVGICSGAYLAAAEPTTYGLGLAAVEVVDRANWDRGSGIVQLISTREENVSFPMAYANGPLLSPIEVEGRPAIEALATFATTPPNFASPDKVKAMPGKVAVLRTHYGKGRVLLYSTHPEFSNGAAQSAFSQNLLWLNPYHP